MCGYKQVRERNAAPFLELFIMPGLFTFSLMEKKLIDKVVRRIFGAKRKEVRSWRNLYNEEVCSF
jgi:hypothetical protein